MPAVDVTPALCPPPSLALGRSRCNGSGKSITPAGVHMCRASAARSGERQQPPPGARAHHVAPVAPGRRQEHHDPDRHVLVRHGALTQGPDQRHDGRRPPPTASSASSWRTGPWGPRTGPGPRALRSATSASSTARGNYIRPEGTPAGMAPLDGTRLLVLHPPNGSHALGVGRVFEHMVPSLRLDRILEPAEAQHWLARLAPAVQHDLMAQRLLHLRLRFRTYCECGDVCRRCRQQVPSGALVAAAPFRLAP